MLKLTDMQRDLKAGQRIVNPTYQRMTQDNRRKVKLSSHKPMQNQACTRRKRAGRMVMGEKDVQCHCDIA